MGGSVIYCHHVRHLCVLCCLLGILCPFTDASTASVANQDSEQFTSQEVLTDISTESYGERPTASSESNLEESPFLHILFEKYGENGIITFEGFERLLHNLGLGHIDKNSQNSLNFVNNNNQSDLETNEHSKEDDISSDSSKNHRARARNAKQELKARRKEEKAKRRREKLRHSRTKRFTDLIEIDYSKYQVCMSATSIMHENRLQSIQSLTMETFQKICPALVAQLDQQICDFQREHDDEHHDSEHDHDDHDHDDHAHHDHDDDEHQDHRDHANHDHDDDEHQDHDDHAHQDHDDDEHQDHDDYAHQDHDDDEHQDHDYHEHHNDDDHAHHDHDETGHSSDHKLSEHSDEHTADETGHFVGRTGYNDNIDALRHDDHDDHDDHSSHEHHHHDHDSELESDVHGNHSNSHAFSDIPLSVWGYSLAAVAIISLVGLLCVAVIPVMNHTSLYNHILQFLVAMAIGSLAGDALLHLIPHALGTHEEDPHGHTSHVHDKSGVWLGLVCLGGIFLFFLMERLVGICGKWRRKRRLAKKKNVSFSVRPEFSNDMGTELSGHNDAVSSCEEILMAAHPGKDVKSMANDAHKEVHRDCLPDAKDSWGGHGHSHGHNHSHQVPGSVGAVAWMVIMGDGLHNFSDGLAIGAAFANSLTGGLSTSVAVLCHELPHEMGDFAVLLHAGMPIKQAIIYNMVSSVLCLLGMIVGISIGNLSSASLWIFAVIAGMFLYIALVDMLPEMTSVEPKADESPLCHLLLQCAGMALGSGIMLVIAIYEEHITLPSFEP